MVVKLVVPFRWALAFAIVATVAGLSCGFIVGGLIEERGTPNPDRYVVDVREIKVPGERPVWSIRWLEYGQVRMVQLEGTDDKDRLVEWLGRR